MAASGLWMGARGAACLAGARGQGGFLACLQVPLWHSHHRRGIAGKAMREEVKKPKPFPYEKRQFGLLQHLLGDRTTLRFDENTKVVVVEGAHAVGKTKFAKELAEELGMKYHPAPNMDMFFKSPYGKVDIRDYKQYLLPRIRPYDEKDFSRDPTSVPGCTDRFIWQLYAIKFKQYLLGLRHLFNTGQGVVLERSCYSDYCNLEAAYNAGWVDRESKRWIQDGYKATLQYTLRPNLIIYLDAPVDVVQKKIAARGNEWDKDSPVWTNTEYLNDLYNLMKKDYLKQAQPHSHVLVYDWSEPGDTEIVVEDIEKLNFDYYGQFEEPQKDWRLYNEEYTTFHRIKFSRLKEFRIMMGNMMNPSSNYDAEQMYYTAEEILSMKDVLKYLPHHKYMYGYNKDAGDKGILFKFWGLYEASWRDMMLPFDSPPRRSFWEPSLTPD